MLGFKSRRKRLLRGQLCLQRSVAELHLRFQFRLPPQRGLCACLQLGNFSSNQFLLSLRSPSLRVGSLDSGT